MKSVLQIVILISIALGLNGCRSSNDKLREAQSADTPDVPSIHFDRDRMICDAKDDPYSCLRQACIAAGAEFDEGKKLCTCEADTLFYATKGGACIGHTQISGFKSDFQFGDRDHYFVSDFSKSLTQQQMNSVFLNRSIPVGFSIHTILYTDANRLKNFLIEEGYDQSFNSLGLPSTELNWITGNSGFSNRIVRKVEQFFLFERDDVIKLADSELAALLNQAVASVKDTKLIAPESVRSFSELGCAEICIEKSLISEGAIRRIYRIRTFSGGNPFQDTINIFNKEKLVVEAMAVLLNERPSHIFLSGENGSFKSYSIRGEPLTIASEALSQKPTVHQDFGNAVPVAVFETQYDSKADSAAVFGPFEDSNYFGWFSKSDQRPYFYGKTLSLLGEEDFTSDLHSANVTRIASADYVKPILPLSITALTLGDFTRVLEYGRWPRMAANLSMALTYTPDVCRESELAKQIRATSSSVLWSVGAGNEGIAINSRNLPFCPQSLNEKNLIIVAATDGGERLSSASSYGEKYADVAERGCASERPCSDGATSYASPRVARLSADLMAKFPQLSPEQIKWVILATSKVPRNWRGTADYLPVRSGGIVDPNAASLLIDQLLKEPILKPESIDLHSLTENEMGAISRALLLAKSHQFSKATQKQKKIWIKEQLDRILKLSEEETL